MTRATTRFCFLSLLALGAACGIDTHPGATCDDDNPCPAGQDCYRGFCVAEGCEEGMMRDCYTGPEGTRGQGECEGGMRTCVDGVFGACLGQTTPSAEECNDMDDDCDTFTDEIAGEECATRMPGVCAAGTFVCTEDRGGQCEQSVEASDEVCNSLDDDCDGSSDEGLEGGPCYPAETVGCTPDGGGGFACVGLCNPGTFACSEEGGQICVGAILPVEDVMDGCTAEGEAVDDDCDGSVDEDCPCTPDDTQDCYGGPVGTAGVGPCLRGTQTCGADNRFGACEGEVRPEPETCGNMEVDNDCNGITDDIPTLGDSCSVEGNLGACANGALACDGSALVCDTPDPTDEICNDVDDNCDGTVDEGFDTTSDPMNCGGCGVTCENDCCDSTCVNTRQDETHCGACADAGGTTCEVGDECCAGSCNSPAVCAGCAENCADSGTTCCSMECVDTQSDENNCGECGNTCGAGEFCCGGECTPESEDSCGQGCDTCGASQLCCRGGCVDQGMADCDTCGTGCGGTCCTDGRDGLCVDTQSDEANCGTCGFGCPDGNLCCGGDCANVDTDPDNCGVCGRRCARGAFVCGLIGSGAEVCVGGECECP